MDTLVLQSNNCACQPLFHLARGLHADMMSSRRGGVEVVRGVAEAGFNRRIYGNMYQPRFETEARADAGWPPAYPVNYAHDGLRSR